MELRKEIDNLKYLFLSHIEEPAENAFGIIVHEGQVGPPEDQEIAGVTIEAVRPISVEEGSCGYAIVFESYVSYAVRNESYTTWDDDEEWEGKLFRLYTKSYFLDFVARATFASEKYPGPFKHYSIICENHIIDVVSTDEPEIERWIGA